MRYVFTILSLIVLSAFIEPRAQAAPPGKAVCCLTDTIATAQVLPALPPDALATVDQNGYGSMIALDACLPPTRNSAKEVLLRVWDTGDRTPTSTLQATTSPVEALARLPASAHLLC